VRAGYRMDGVRWMPGIPDESSSYEDADKAQFAVAIGVTEGRHEVLVSEWEYPPVPQPPPRRELRLAAE
jgi:hypothetical protein